MIEPELFRTHPVLSLPLRWRLEIAALCMAAGSVVPLLPESAFYAVLSLGFVCMAVMWLYSINADGDRSALATRRPVIEAALYVLCLGGVMITGYIRWANDDYLRLDGFPLFVMALVMLSLSKGA